jgi:hypothetical protein
MLTYLPDAGRMLAEAHRVLKPAAMLIWNSRRWCRSTTSRTTNFRFTRYGAVYLLHQAGFEMVEVVPVGGLWARVGLTMIAALNAVNRGPTRILTELPVRLLYVILQTGFELLDRLFFDPREVLAHVVVARRRG